MKCVDRISFPLFPTEEQKQLMIRNCHNARFAYNWGVAKVLECLDRHELPPSRYTLASEFNRFKHTPGYEWLTNNHASQRATKYAIVKQLDNAMQKYLKEHRRPPTFKSKKSGARMSYYTHEETIKFTPGFVKLEGLGMVKCYHDITDLSNIKITEPVVILQFQLELNIKLQLNKNITILMQIFILNQSALILEFVIQQLLQMEMYLIFQILIKLIRGYQKQIEKLISGDENSEILITNLYHAI